MPELSEQWRDAAEQVIDEWLLVTCSEHCGNRCGYECDCPDCPNSSLSDDDYTDLIARVARVIWLGAEAIGALDDATKTSASGDTAVASGGL